MFVPLSCKLHPHVQVYVRSETSEVQQQLAKQALYHHCTPLLHSDPLDQSSMPVDPNPASPNQDDPSSTPVVDSAFSQQLILVKPCAWPYPVTVSHFANDAVLATTARDSALWESHIAQYLALCLTQADAATVYTAASPSLQVLLPGLCGNSARVTEQREGELSQAELVVRLQPQLHLAWQSAACFAERASDKDRNLRQQWFALMAAQMKVIITCCCTTSDSLDCFCCAVF